ncbi:TPA: hypothetical protein I7282_25070 [Vibrio parahaemolyticus]|nr:hypothetical protein [Vibrio parahaemolyticus]
MSKTIAEKYDDLLIANERALYLVRTLLEQMCEHERMDYERIMMNLSITESELEKGNANAL